MLHAARQLPAWLIFDVSQKKMTEAEIEAVVCAELDRRGIPHPQGVSVSVKEESFSPAAAPEESILGRIKIGANEFLATLKAIATTKIVKITLWLFITAIPNAQFYFPSQYEIGKKLAFDTITQIVASFDTPKPNDYGPYIVVNTEWKDSREAYDADRIRYFGNLPTGSLSVPVTAYRGPISAPDFTISGSFHV
jgi:hypothetical protein